MPTLAPYSAKRTAIAWPIPEVPPVTRTFLPFSPRMPSLGVAGAVIVIASSWFRARFEVVGRSVSAGRCPLHAAPRAADDEQGLPAGPGHASLVSESSRPGRRGGQTLSRGVEG